MEALPADAFRMGDQLVGGIIVAAHHSPAMLRNLVWRMGPLLAQADVSDLHSVFRALIQYSLPLDGADRHTLLDEFLDRAVDVRRLGDYIHDLVSVMGGNEVIEAHLAIARLLRKQPQATRCEHGVMMARRVLRDLLAFQPSHSPSLTQPHHPLREALGLVDRGYPGAAALFEEDWVKYASRGDLFGIINPDSGLILTLLMEWGVDSNRCLNRVMALETIESLDPVGWCLDAGADYQIVIDSSAAWKEQALEVVHQHPSWRRMALGKALPKRVPNSEVRAL